MFKYFQSSSHNVQFIFRFYPPGYHIHPQPDNLPATHRHRRTLSDVMTYQTSSAFLALRRTLSSLSHLVNLPRSHILHPPNADIFPNTASLSFQHPQRILRQPEPNPHQQPLLRRPNRQPITQPIYPDRQLFYSILSIPHSEAKQSSQIEARATYATNKTPPPIPLPPL
jgi:hypothetical protein